MAKYEHVIWDWNGTLLDDAEKCVEVLNVLLKKYNKPAVRYEDYREEFDFPVKDYYVKLGFDFGQMDYEQIAVEYISEYNRRRFECCLHEGAVETLGAIRRAGLGQSILSAYSQKMLVEAVEHFGIRGFFGKVCGLDDHFAVGKIEIGKKMVEQIGIGKAKILMVGDTVHDLEVSEAMGIACVLIPDGHHSKEKLAASGAKVIESINEVLIETGIGI